MALARASVRRRGQFGALDHYATRLRDGADEAFVPPPTVRDIGWAVEAAARTLPWNTLCLTQAVAATRMLSRRGVDWVLHVGLDRDEGELIAHAWVTSGTKVVVGGAGVARFARLVAYAPRGAVEREPRTDRGHEPA